MKVLILDDNKGFADSMARILNSRGHEALSLQSAEDALKVMRAGFRPDVRLVDMGVTDMRGDAFIRSMTDSWKLEQDPTRPASPPPPVVAITGMSSMEDVATLPNGMEVLHKPVDPEVLIARLEAAFGLMHPEKTSQE